MNEDRISQLTDVFKELADTAGGFERTKIFPNLEVIDATPSALPADYIIIQDDEGYYIPALKVPGLVYSDGDLVNVLFIKGTEPIAFQQGVGSPSSPSASVTIRKNSGANVGARPRLNFIEGSDVTLTMTDDALDNEIDITITSSGGGGNVWPKAGENLLESVNYATVTLLLAAMAPGAIGYIGPNSSAEAVDVDVQDVTLQGVGRIITRFTSPFLVSDVLNGSRIEDIGVVVSSTGTAAIRITDGLVDFVDVAAEHNDVEDARAFQLEANARLFNCEGIADSDGSGTPTARAVYVTNSATVEIHGGNFSASTGTADEIFVDAGAFVLLDGPTLEFGNFGGAGDASGWYLDSVGGVHFVSYTATGLKEWQFNSSGNLVSTANSKLFLGDGSTEAPLNITERATEPSSPNAEDIYLDDGSNTGSGDPGFRRYTGAVWEDIGGGGGSGGWPFAHVLTVSTTDPDADYADIDDAITAAAAGDTIQLDSETYTGPFTLNKNVTLRGAAQGDTVITQGGAGVTLTISTAGAAVEDLTVINTFATGTVKAISITASCRLRNVIAQSTGAATTGEAIFIDGATVDLFDCEGSATTATTKIGLDVNNSSVVNVYGGVYGGANFDVLSDASTVNLVEPILTNSIVLSGTSTIKGSYRNASGDIVLVGSSILAGVDKYIISATVATSDLTVALKTLAGTDPSEGSPIFVKIGDVVRPITAALSVTALDGTNWFSSGAATTATLDVDYFVYLIQETGASAGTKIGFARIPYATTMANFVNTATSQFYIKGNWTNFNATDQVTLIGRFNAILSATAAFTWSLTTAVIINRPIFETRRLSFTSAITSQTGTITTVGTVTSSYIVAGRYFYMWQSIGITTNGTGATAILSTIPLTPGGILTVMPGREVLVSGKMLQGYVQATTTATWVNFDNTYPAASGANLACGGVAIPLV